MPQEQRFELLLREFLLFLAATPDFCRFIVQASLDGGTRLDWLVRRFLEPMHRSEVALLKRAQRSGAFIGGGEDADPEATAHLRYVFVGAATAVFLHAREIQLSAGIDTTDPAFLRRHADVVLRIFARPD